MNNNCLIYILILNWNGWKDTLECVESCLRLKYSRFKILIVDNGSTDTSEVILRKQLPNIEFIQTGTNLGFAGGNNVGIRYALERGADYVWLLNNDTVVAPDALSALIDVAETDVRVGMVGSKIHFFNTPRLLWYAGAVLDPAMPHRVGHRGLNEEDQGQYDETGETGFVTGCSLLVRREVIEEIGLLDEHYFLYAEDADWNVQARRAGWKLVYSHRSIVLHKISASMGGMESPRMNYYLARNLLYFIKKNYPSFLLKTFVSILFQNVIVMIKKRRLTSAKWAIKGILDFLRGRSGPMCGYR